jgi:hypothetical protein
MQLEMGVCTGREPVIDDASPQHAVTPQGHAVYTTPPARVDLCRDHTDLGLHFFERRS